MRVHWFAPKYVLFLEEIAFVTPDILRRTAALALEHLLSMAADGHLEVHQEENDFKDNITIQTRSETQEWTLTQAFSKTFLFDYLY